MANQQPSAVASSFVLIIFTLANVCFGLITHFVYARAFGTTSNMDSFWLSFAIISVFQQGIVGAFNPTLVPALVGAGSGTLRQDALLKRFLVRIGGFSLALSVLLALIANQLVTYLAPGFSEAQQALTTSLLRIQAPSIAFFTFMAVAASSFHARRRFTLPAASVAINGLVILIVSIFAIPRIGIIGAAIGYTAGYFIQLFAFVPTLLKIRRAHTRLVTREEFCVLLRAFAWLIVGAFLLNMYVVLERFIASNLSEGAVSYLGYGHRVVSVLNLMFISTLATYLLPQFSESLQTDTCNRGTNVLTAYKMSTILSAPLVMGGIACINYVIFLFLQHGAFSARDTEQLTYTIWAYGLGAFIIGNGSIITNAVYAVRQPKILIIAALGAVFVWLPIAIYAAQNYQHLGIAAAYFFFAGTLVLLQVRCLKGAIDLPLHSIISFTCANLMIGILIWASFIALAPSDFSTVNRQGYYVFFAAVALSFHYFVIFTAFRNDRATRKLVLHFRSVLGK